MIDDSALAKIEELEKKYKQIYGVYPDINDWRCISGITIDIIAEVLERMVDENESFIVAYGKLFGKQN